MAFEIMVIPLTAAQRVEVIELQQKIEAINSAIETLQIERRDAMAKYLEGFADQWSNKEIALAAERNKCLMQLKTLRQVDIKVV